VEDQPCRRWDAASRVARGWCSSPPGV